MPRKRIYEGISVVQVDAESFDALKGGKEIQLPRRYQPNEGLVVKSSGTSLSNKKTPSTLAIHKGGSAIPVLPHSAYSLSPRNKEQALLLSLLLDPSIQVVTSTGIAGTGKSILAVAAGLEQVFGPTATYRKIIYVKSTVVSGRDLGYLPGSYEDKVAPYMGALYDCLQIVKGRKDLSKLLGFEDNAKIQMMSSQYVRGRTFRKSYVVVDEAQNFTTADLKTLLTRLDEDSKMIILGDVDQSDVKHLEGEDGLVQVVEKFKSYDLFGHINLIKSERSRLAQLVGEVLV